VNILPNTAANRKEKPAFDSLGNNTKSPHPPLSKFRLQDLSRRLQPSARIKSCCRKLLDGADFVTVKKHASGSHSYGNVMKCGSVWICPVCANRIVNYRRKDLADFIDAAGRSGDHIALLTLTIPHGFGDSLVETLERIGKAKELMQHRKQWQTIARDMGLVGQIRTLEVTHGQNGWHPHFHILLFTNRIIEEGIQARILEAWQKACLSVGAPLPNQHGVDLKKTTKGIADYVQKWGVDYEMTHGIQKVTRSAKGRSPFQLLADSTQDSFAGWLFVEYAEAMKGKRQLVYSKGLRKRYGFDQDLSDQEIIDQEEKQTMIVGVIPRPTWAAFLRSSIDCRGVVLEAFRCSNSITDVNRLLVEQGINHSVLLPPWS